MPNALAALYDAVTWTQRQQDIADRLDTLADIENAAETMLLPFLNSRMTDVVLRQRKLFDRADKLLANDELDRADIVCDQIEGGLTELRVIASERVEVATDTTAVIDELHAWPFEEENK